MGLRPGASGVVNPSLRFTSIREKKDFVLKCAYIVGQVLSSKSTLTYNFIVCSMPRQPFRILISTKDFKVEVIIDV